VQRLLGGVPDGQAGTVSTTDYVDTSAQPNTTYTYQVSMIGPTGESAPVSSPPITTPAVADPAQPLATNPFPVATSQVIYLDANDVEQDDTYAPATVTGTLSASGGDGSALYYSMTQNPSDGTLTLDHNTGNFTFTPAEGFNGIDSMIFTATDDAVTSNLATLVIVRGGDPSHTVTLDDYVDGDDTLTIANGQATITHGNFNPSLNISVDGVPGSYGTVWSVDPDIATHGPVSLVWQGRGSVTAQQSGNTVSVLVDDDPESGSGQYNVTVEAGLNLADGASEHLATWENTPLSLVLPFTDTSDTPILVSDDRGNPADGGRDIQLGANYSVTFTPQAGFVGRDWFTYQLRNSEGILGPYQTIFVDVVQPTVSITPLDPNALAAGPNGTPQPAWFKISQDANTDESVDLAVAGSEPGAAYTLTNDLSGSAVDGAVQFMPGQRTILVQMDPNSQAAQVPEAVSGMDNTVIATLTQDANSAYAPVTPVSATATVNAPTAISASVSQLTFGARNGLDFHAVQQDGTSYIYGGVEWQAGAITPTRDYPICYTRSGVNDKTDEMTIAASFDTAGFVGGNDEIQAEFFSPDQSVVTARASETDGVLSGEIVAPIAAVVGDYLTRIVWRVSNDGGKTWIDAGTTSNKTYVTNGNPAGNQLLETVLNTGCSFAAGQTAYVGIVNSIWAGFAARTITRADGQPMYYWGQVASAEPDNQDDYTAAGLIAQADGRCGAWANFFVDVLGAQGIGASVWGITPNGSAYAANVAAWQSIAGFDTVVEPGQNNSNPRQSFANHAVVKLLGASSVYDPSYGRWFITEQAWRDGSELDFIDQGGQKITNHVNGTKDTYFTRM
jgi:hypothetical protein